MGPAMKAEPVERCVRCGILRHKYVACYACSLFSNAEAMK